MSFSDTEDDFLKSLEAHGPNDAHPFGLSGSPSRESSPIGGTPPPEDNEDGSQHRVPLGLDEHAVDPALIPDTATTPESRELTEMAQRVKRFKSLGERSESDLDKFAATNSMAGHMVLLYAGILEVRDIAERFQQNSSWSIPDALSDDLRKYATAFVLCHNISSYRGKVSKALMDAMRELNISTLPQLKETSQNKQVVTELGNCLTQARFTLRDLIIKSTEDEAGISNIADLAHAVIGKTDFKPTVQMYMCLAFLRWMYEKYPNLDGNKWWVKVDESLVTMRKRYTTEKELSNIFNLRYKEDVKKYSNPSDSERKVCSASLLPNWQVVLQAHAKKVEIASPGSNSGRKSKKRSAPDS